MDFEDNKIIGFIKNNLKTILISFGVLLLVVLFLVFFNNKYSKYEKEMIKKSHNYFNGTNYVTLKEMHLKYDECRDYSGVYYNGNTYQAYLFCDNYVSTNELISKNITLNGSNPIVIKTTDEYVEAGYTSNYEVRVSSNYKKEEGLYFVNYLVFSNNSLIDKATRIVIVKDIFNSKSLISLRGESNVILFKGEKYVETGYTAYDEFGNDISSLVKVEGTVDVNKPGTYKINYYYEDGIKKMTATRTIKVLDLNTIIELSETEPILNENEINLIVTGKDYEYTLLPNGEKTSERSIVYPVNINKIYNFKIYSNNKYLEKSINVNNIYTAIEASCTLSQGPNGVFTTVDAKGGYGKLQYSYLDKDKYSSYTESSVYNFNNKVNKTTVNIKDTIGNNKTITCSNPLIKVDPLEIHFIKVSTGRYDAILMRQGDLTLFIDGGYLSFFKQIDRYLKSIGVDHIDVLIGSHGHANHVEVHSKLIREYNVKEVYYNEDIYNCKSCDSDVYKDTIKALKEKNITPHISKQGSSFYFGEARFDTIGPYVFNSSPNVYSNNYIVTFQGVKILLTGDGVDTKNILKNYSSSELKVDIFKWPHHGQHGLAADFLKAISPKYIVVTSHQDSLSDESKSRIKSFKPTVFYHYKDGNIVFVIEEGKIKKYTNVDPAKFKVD